MVAGGSAVYSTRPGTGAKAAGRAVRTTLSRPSNGFGIASKVARPITTTPACRETAANIRLSSRDVHVGGSRGWRPMRPSAVTAATAITCIAGSLWGSLPSCHAHSHKPHSPIRLPCVNVPLLPSPLSITEKGQKAPALRRGMNRSPSCRNRTVVRDSHCSTLPTQSCLGVPWYIGPTGKSMNVPLDSVLHASEMHNSLGLLACQSPHKHLLTAQGPADTVTVSVPPEYASRVARPVDG